MLLYFLQICTLGISITLLSLFNQITMCSQSSNSDFKLNPLREVHLITSHYTNFWVSVSLHHTGGHLSQNYPFSCQKSPKIIKTTLKSLSGWPCPSICPHFPSPTGPKQGNCPPRLKAAVIVQQSSQTRRTRAQTVTGVEDTMVKSTCCTFVSCWFFFFIYWLIDLFRGVKYIIYYYY